MNRNLRQEPDTSRCRCVAESTFRGNDVDRKVSQNLAKVAIATNGWEVLYKCLTCGQLWEKIYPQSEYQGGGIPELQKVSPDQVKEKYTV